MDDTRLLSMDDTRLFTAAQELNGCLRKVLKMKTPGLIQMVTEIMEEGGIRLARMPVKWKKD